LARINIAKRGLDIAEYLEEEEIPILIENTPTLQKRAFLAYLYESGSRPEEFLRLSNLVDPKTNNVYVVDSANDRIEPFSSKQK
jgi:hypothetical protein